MGKVSFSNEGVAAMRDAMDKALAAPNGLRMRFSDTDPRWPSREEAHKAAKRMQGYAYTARSQMRRVQARAFSESDGAITDTAPRALAALSGKGDTPDAFRTAYDSLYLGIDRNEADDAWVLTIQRVDVTSFIETEMF